ncbi:cyclase family protein [Streptomyces sp. NPDC002917]|uniref:cyclase family protein n=1 Tax=Streptomyces sp. NPDC002917 TaxID=3364671 RepID=UPI00369BBA71
MTSARTAEECSPPTPYRSSSTPRRPTASDCDRQDAPFRTHRTRDEGVRTRLVDLSHRLQEGCRTIRCLPAPRWSSRVHSPTTWPPGGWANIPSSGGCFVNEQIALSGHTGTRLDAPLHAGTDRPDTAEIDLAACVGAATHLDLRKHCGARVVLTAEDLAAALPEVLNTGWADPLAEDPDRYYRNSMRLTRDGALFLRDGGVRCIGIDAPTPRVLRRTCTSSNGIPSST